MPNACDPFPSDAAFIIHLRRPAAFWHPSSVRRDPPKLGKSQPTPSFLPSFSTCVRAYTYIYPHIYKSGHAIAHGRPARGLPTRIGSFTSDREETGPGDFCLSLNGEKLLEKSRRPSHTQSIGCWRMHASSGPPKSRLWSVQIWTVGMGRLLIGCRSTDSL